MIGLPILTTEWSKVVWIITQTGKHTGILDIQGATMIPISSIFPNYLNYPNSSQIVNRMPKKINLGGVVLGSQHWWSGNIAGGVPVYKRRTCKNVNLYWG